MQDNPPVPSTAAKGAIYVIASKDYLTTCDISDTIHELHTDAQVICHLSIEAAIADICRQDTIAVVFAEAGIALVDQLKLDQIVLARDGKLVLMGTAAEAELEAAEIGSYPWPVLCRPFSAAVIKAWLPPQHTAPKATAGNNSAPDALPLHLRIVD
ncbi:hypothetical protein [Phaeobacter gallaeciensis]|uniref:Uncharacterized protein n=1 Tax=Phaeobacter gallaeciensis TaxID=60890 RepID=A0AAD0ECM3_9RHOB|nr:hypothetical protein [Phaeobacter gallaeciensis]AHD09232.1 hypothetical protein Gal_01470 [Phaeobacter gallaeciensis DSM 26640]ATE92495.1 hypothetical protein PhaeoP11_01461 [Phaeobacter gallaeciensis]ATE97683.1 hypothetical protein PhaeoP73_02385 [Phaeobacter gallaeciensis]ATF01160.1 hypothetical protein PhaeoP75_01511 [Phaeobacter gallaeciensis]ATF05540.1 hypothetical protein PhaeoP63_01459 [Phaeobacter gallaeciensis]